MNPRDNEFEILKSFMLKTLYNANRDLQKKAAKLPHPTKEQYTSFQDKNKKLNSYIEANQN